MAQKAIKQGGASAAGRLDFIAQQLLARPSGPTNKKSPGPC